MRHQEFSLVVTDAGIAECELTGRKAACVRVEPRGVPNLGPKVIDRRRITEYLVKAMGAAELLGATTGSVSTGSGHSLSTSAGRSESVSSSEIKAKTA